jgi:hypothetical protein
MAFWPLDSCSYNSFNCLLIKIFWNFWNIHVLGFSKIFKFLELLTILNISKLVAIFFFFTFSSSWTLKETIIVENYTFHTFSNTGNLKHVDFLNYLFFFFSNIHHHLSIPQNFCHFQIFENSFLFANTDLWPCLNVFNFLFNHQLVFLYCLFLSQTDPADCRSVTSCDTRNFGATHSCGYSGTKLRLHFLHFLSYVKESKSRAVPVLDRAPCREDVWKNEGIDPCIFKLGITWRWVVSFLLSGKSPWYAEKTGWTSWAMVKERNILLPAGDRT